MTSLPAPSPTSAALVMRCDPSGRLREVVVGTLRVARLPEPGDWALGMVDAASETKARRFLEAALEPGGAFGWSLNVATPEGPMATQFSGGRVGDTVYVVATPHRHEGVYLLEDSLPAETGADTLRRSIRGELRETHRTLEREGRLFEEVARITNELATVQRELERKNRQLARANEELAASNAELEQFAYVVGHDLQEPLRMITGFGDLLRRRHGTELDPEAAEFLQYVVDGAAHLRRLVADLLTYARLGGAEVALEPVDAAAAARRAVALLSAAVEDAGAVVEIGPLPTVRGNAALLQQVFQNLVANALKFRAPERPPRVTLSAERQGSDWCFTVADNGIGIAPDAHERVFRLFQRLHAPDAYAGTGLGLAVCRKAVERQGGRIWLDSAPGEGTAFHFTIPA